MQATEPAKPAAVTAIARTASYITTADAAQLYYKDWVRRTDRMTQPRLAAELGQLGVADDLPGQPRLPRHCT